MPDYAIEFVLVQDKETGGITYIPRALYDNESSLWKRLDRKTVIADQAPVYDPETSAASGEKTTGQQAAPMKENS